MAKSYATDGIEMNQSNSSTAYMKVVSFGKNDIGTFLRITASTSAPRIYFHINSTIAFTQTNGSSDFNSTTWKKTAFMYNAPYGYTSMLDWGTSSGSNITLGYTQSNPTLDLYIWSSTAGSWPGKFSIVMEIYCTRWDWVTLTKL